jgi:hypothetical protein
VDDYVIIGGKKQYYFLYTYQHPQQPQSNFKKHILLFAAQSKADDFCRISSILCGRVFKKKKAFLQ